MTAHIVLLQNFIINSDFRDDKTACLLAHKALVLKLFRFKLKLHGKLPYRMTSHELAAFYAVSDISCVYLFQSSKLLLINRCDSKLKFYRYSLPNIIYGIIYADSLSKKYLSKKTTKNPFNFLILDKAPAH